MQLGNIIRQLRENKGFTRDEVANQLNITYSALSKYEINDRFPDRKILIDIADLYEVSLDYLLGRSDFKSSFHFRKIKNSTIVEEIMDLEEENIKKVQEYIELLKLKQNSNKDKSKL
ncbi:MAG: helix-turn-helix transcriptional regulator [Peptostreptococcaceae bacterium]